MSVKIEHGGDAVSNKGYVITRSDGKQAICWDDSPIYEAIQSLQSQVEEQQQEIESLRTALLSATAAKQADKPA